MNIKEIENQAGALACRMGLRYQSEQWQGAVQDAIVAGWEASQRDNGTGIRAYVFEHIRGAILHYLTRFENNKGHCVPVSTVFRQSGEYESDGIEIDQDGQLALTYTEQFTLPGIDQNTPEGDLLRRERSAAVQEAIESLPDRDRAILEARLDGEKLESIGERMGITKAYVQKIEAGIHVRLRKELEEYA